MPNGSPATRRCAPSSAGRASTGRRPRPARWAGLKPGGSRRGQPRGAHRPVRRLDRPGARAPAAGRHHPRPGQLGEPDLGSRKARPGTATSAAPASLTGPAGSSPSGRDRVAGLVLLFVVGTGPPHDAVGGTGEPIYHTCSTGRGHGRCSGFTRSRVPTTGPPQPKRSWCLGTQAAATAGAPHRKLVPSTHIRCRITASLRASATLARFMPRAPGDRERPALEAREPTGPGQHRRWPPRRGGPHHRVADLADPAADVGLARLVLASA